MNPIDTLHPASPAEWETPVLENLGTAHDIAGLVKVGAYGDSSVGSSS